MNVINLTLTKDGRLIDKSEKINDKVKKKTDKPKMSVAQPKKSIEQPNNTKDFCDTMKKLKRLEIEDEEELQEYINSKDGKAIRKLIINKLENLLNTKFKILEDSDNRTLYTDGALVLKIGLTECEDDYDYMNWCIKSNCSSIIESDQFKIDEQSYTKKLEKCIAEYNKYAHMKGISYYDIYTSTVKIVHNIVQRKRKGTENLVLDTCMGDSGNEVIIKYKKYLEPTEYRPEQHLNASLLAIDITPLCSSNTEEYEIIALKLKDLMPIRDRKTNKVELVTHNRERAVKCIDIENKDYEQTLEFFIKDQFLKAFNNLEYYS